MIVRHSAVTLEGGVSEHRVVVDMTALEAALWLAAQPSVRNEAARGIRTALAGCDQRPMGR